MNQKLTLISILILATGLTCLCALTFTLCDELMLQRYRKGYSDGVAHAQALAHHKQGGKKK